ncbi:MAG: DUF6364 family protein [Opitutales bacterium]
MKQKLTLTADAEVVDRIKGYAHARQCSVSSLFESWGLMITKDRPSCGLGERMRGIWKTGALQEPDDRLEYLLKKHGEAE